MVLGTSHPFSAFGLIPGQETEWTVIISCRIHSLCGKTPRKFLVMETIVVYTGATKKLDYFTSSLPE